MSNILIVYFSLTGNTKTIAEKIATICNADILELKLKKELKPDKGMTYFWGGFQATMKRKPKLVEFDINPFDYELIIIGTPVWAWTFSPPIRSFISKFKLNGKNVILFVSCDGNGEKAMKRFKEALKETNIISDSIFQNHKQEGIDEKKEKAIEWAKKISENYI
ncbi:MAG: flavodoxin [Candidatus Lokiarchaeota archaeon]|nr:flavodoxin [Candidatus Lokiarchaeota archaeon]